jgi:hypothetical protein
MLTSSDIRNQLADFLEAHDFYWMQDELLYGEIPVVYWTNKLIYFKVQVTERQNAVYFEVAKFSTFHPFADSISWINLYSFSNEYKRRINLPISELVKQTSGEIIDCFMQIEKSKSDLIQLLNIASNELL